MNLNLTFLKSALPLLYSDNAIIVKRKCYVFDALSYR